MYVSDLDKYRSVCIGIPIWFTKVNSTMVYTIKSDVSYDDFRKFYSFCYDRIYSGKLKLYVFGMLQSSDPVFKTTHWTKKVDMTPQQTLEYCKYTS